MLYLETRAILWSYLEWVYSISGASIWTTIYSWALNILPGILCFPLTLALSLVNGPSKDEGYPPWKLGLQWDFGGQSQFQIQRNLAKICTVPHCMCLCSPNLKINSPLLCQRQKLRFLVLSTEWNDPEREAPRFRKSHWLARKLISIC